MADFRRVVTALAVLALLTGLAVSANAQAFTCNASAAVPPLLRGEGLTELTGDIVLNCSGSGAGGTANFTVFVGNTTVTSRILNTATNESEALLLINEPGSPVLQTGTTPVPGATAFSGVVSNNSVTFTGVPIVPPGSTGTVVYRITNVRVNAVPLASAVGSIPGTVQAFVSISGSTSVPINNPTQTIGFVQNGLNFTVRNSTNAAALATAGLSFKQCDNTAFNKTVQAFVRFSEQFATAFKTVGATTQTTPGAIYSTESGLTSVTVNGKVAGLADSGTRLRATFNNIPTGTTVYVGTVNAVPTSATVATPIPATAAVAPYASLITSETNGAAAPTTGSITNGGFTLVPVSLASGSGVAVWEVTAASPLALENFDFPIAFATTPSPGTNSPATGVTGTVAGSLAPAPPAFTVAAGSVASSSLNIPRFRDSAITVNLVLFNICQTRLLFPYAVATDRFDTGIAITNTSKDTQGTTPQTGKCTLNFFGKNAPAAALDSPIIGDGTTQGVVYATTLFPTVAPGFSGYIIAVCDFQFAHGFAFVSDIGASNIAMGYLALVMNDTRTATEALNQ